MPLSPNRNPMRRLPAVIERATLTLRIPTREDGTAVFDAVSETLPSLRQFSAFMPWANHPPSVAASTDFCVSARAAFDEARDYAFLIVRHHDDRVLGSCGLHHVDLDGGRAEVGFWIRKSEQGKGVAKKAIQAIVASALEHLGIQHVRAVTDGENVACRRLCERVGFTLHEVRKQDRKDISGVWRDACVYRASSNALLGNVA